MFVQYLFVQSCKLHVNWINKLTWQNQLVNLSQEVNTILPYHIKSHIRPPPKKKLKKKRRRRKKKKLMIFKPKRNEFKKIKIKAQKSFLFSFIFFHPSTTKQRKIGWNMNQTHNQWNSNTTHYLSLMRPWQPLVPRSIGVRAIFVCPIMQIAC